MTEMNARMHARHMPAGTSPGPKYWGATLRPIVGRAAAESKQKPRAELGLAFSFSFR